MSAESLNTLLKVFLVAFVAGNLLGMGLRLRLDTAMVALRDLRFVAYSLAWCFVFTPAIAVGLSRLMPLEAPYAMGMVLIGLAPCAPFLPMVVDRARGDMGCAAAFMLLASVGTALTMPFAEPLLVRGLSVDAWTILEPLLGLMLMPLGVGMTILRRAPGLAARAQPIVTKLASLATVVLVVLCVIIFGEGFVNAAGSYALLTQVIFSAIATTGAYTLAFGLPQRHRSVLGLGVCTRNLAAAFAPLLAVAGIDERAIVMVALGVPVQTIAAFVAARVFRRLAGVQASQGGLPR